MITVGDSGTIAHPQSYATQIQGGSVQGIGMAMLERYVYDPQNGMPAVAQFPQRPDSKLSRRSCRDCMGTRWTSPIRRTRWA